MTIPQKINQIITFAGEMDKCGKDNIYLFKKINELTAKEIKDLLVMYNKEYFFSSGKIQPVNLIRYHFLKIRETGKAITLDEVEKAKERFVQKDRDYFSEYGEDVLAAIDEYKIGKRTPFHVWKEPFRIFYLYFFSGKAKESVNSSLEDISSYIVKELKLTDYSVHRVNFDGSNNFGSTRCWFSFFPSYKMKHTNAVQLFLSIRGSGLEYGVYTGSDLKSMKTVNSDEIDTGLQTSKEIQDIIDFFKTVKPDVEAKNKSIKQFWKYAPGQEAKYWDEMKNGGIMAIGWDNLGDLTQYSDVDAISQALDVSDLSNKSWNLDLFRNASIDDVVLANRGVKTILGIGIIKSGYRFDDTRSYYKHVRDVDWIITEPFTADKRLFRIDTFSPTLKYKEIKKLYIEKYPELKDKFDKVDGSIPVDDIAPVEEMDISEPESEINYFWLNANPSIWNYTELNIGETINYTTHNDRGNKRRIYDYFLKANPGDKVIGYVSTPVKQITTLLEVSQKLFVDDEEGEAVQFRITEFLEKPIDYELLKEHEALKDAEPLRNNQGSLFRLKEDEYNAILDIISNISPGKDTAKIYDKYTLEDISTETGFNEEVLKRYIAVLKSRKQLILQGAPGTGKTYIAEKLARYICQNKENYKVIQFHPSYSYEDFVEGYRPVENGGLKVKSGIFKTICRSAEINKDDNYVLIIDEINRGDVSKIFGELIYLLEYRDKKVNLAYNPEIDFQIPSNLYIIGTMNLADRSLSLMDYALRRRFSFITLEPDYDLINKKNAGSELDVVNIVNRIREINNRIASTPSLGKDFVIGHSYFIGKESKPVKLKTPDDLKWLWEYELKPLLLEYYFDSLEEVRVLEELFLSDAAN